MVFWVFGYGSLVWNPGFEYDEKVIGFIKDYRRVFDLGKYFINIQYNNIIWLSVFAVFIVLLLMHVVFSYDSMHRSQRYT